MKNSSLKISPYFYILLSVSLVYLYFDLAALDQIRSMQLDRFELFNIDELLHYCYAKSAIYHPVALINPFAKVGFTSSCLLFLKVFSENILSLRIMNSIYSLGVLVLMVKIASILKMPKKIIPLSMIMTAFFPVFFLGSISAISELMFSFFLLASIWLIYKEKFFYSALTVAFLPLISQFGFIYLIIWMVLLIKKKKPKLAGLIFIPTILWAILNTVILGHPPFYTIYYRSFLMPRPPMDSLVTVPEFANFYFLIFCPLLLLFIILFLFKGVKYLKGGKLYLIQAVLLFQLLQFVFEIFIMPFFFSGMFSYKIRQLIPAIPLLSILTAYILGKIMQEGRRAKFENYLYILIASLSIIYLPYSVNRLQKFAVIKNEVLSLSQEESAIQAGIWLKGYCKENNISSIVGDGDEIPTSVNRRIWMYAPNNIVYYGTKGLKEIPNSALNLLTYKISPLGRIENCLFIVRDPDKSSVSSELRLVKSFPAISLYFYAK